MLWKVTECSTCLHELRQYARNHPKDPIVVILDEHFLNYKIQQYSLDTLGLTFVILSDIDQTEVGEVSILK